MMMKNRTIVMVIFLILAVSAQAQVSDAVRNIHDKLQAFVASGEYNVDKGRVVNSDEVSGSKTIAYSFSMVFGMDGDNSTILFPHLKELEQTLRSEAMHAKEIYMHDAKEGDPLIPGIQWSSGNANGYVSGKYVFGKKQNIRLLSFDMTNGYRYALLLLWEQQIKQDKQIGNTWLMNGTVFEIHAKKLGHMPFIRPYSERKEQELTATIKYAPGSSSPQTYEELLAKVRQTCQIYQRETTEGKTAAVVILHKMCDGYPNTLTREQYNTLINILHPFTESAVGQKHKEMFGYTCYTLYKKSEHYQDEGGEVKSRPAMIVSSSVTTSQLKKFVTHNGLVVNESSDLQLVNCQISGTAPDDADSISVHRSVSHSEVFGRFPVKNGRFSFTCQLPKDEVCYLLLDNRSMTYFWVDGQPVKADLKHGSVKSSKASQLRNNFVNETEAERVRMLKIKDRAELDAAINRQCERYRQVIFSGKDDLLRTYALYKFYSELTYDELKPFVNNKFRHANHLLMAPVKEYVAGLEKRFPGKHYENVLLVDTLGNYHELKEYVGKGYVVLHFWESWHRDQFDILPQLRILYEKYHKTKNVEIISLATDAINNPNSKWTERLKEEQLPWPQLATKAAWNLYGICSWPETIVIGPDGTIIASPRNVEELENVLETLNPNRSLD